MKLYLAFELDLAGIASPSGQVILDLDFYAADGRIHADVHDVTFCDSALLDVMGKMFGKTLLADEIARSINDSIGTLPQRDPRIKRIEVINPPLDAFGEPVAPVECGG